MNKCFGHLRRFKLTVLILAILLVQKTSHAAGCDNEQIPSPLRNAITRAAANEYREFGGHRINAEGHLWKFGAAETETEPLLNAGNGAPDPAKPGRFAWRRVWEYWLTLDMHVPGEALGRKVLSVPGLLDGKEAATTVTESRLRTLFAALESAGIDSNEGLRQSAVRAAISDTPWSAAFISYVMHQAGLSDSQFHYSSAHWQYVKRAFDNQQDYAYRACDLGRTSPQEGDLLCYSRGNDSPRDYADWLREVQNPRFSTASHCEVVVFVDRAARKMETIGGNVMQSVARRKLKLNNEGLLSRSHYAVRASQDAHGECAQDSTCRQPNLNLHAWSVLLQLQVR